MPCVTAAPLRLASSAALIALAGCELIGGIDVKQIGEGTGVSGGTAGGSSTITGTGVGGSTGATASSSGAGGEGGAGAAGGGGAGGSATPGMVLVPAGEFWMGCNPADPACDADPGTADEKPYHQVFVSAFEIDITEVTQAAFQTCVDAGTCLPPGMMGACAGVAWTPDLTPDHPVVCVSKLQAGIYCSSVDKRLPYEAEWEKAARGTDGRVFPWGSELPSCNRAFFAACDPPVLHPVGSLPLGASPYGALDMAGNAAEWVGDLWDPLYYTNGGPPWSDPQGPSTGTRLHRGGNVVTPGFGLRTSTRDEDTAIMRPFVGFRCARAAS